MRGWLLSQEWTQLNPQRLCGLQICNFATSALLYAYIKNSQVNNNSALLEWKILCWLSYLLTLVNELFVTSLLRTRENHVLLALHASIRETWSQLLPINQEVHKVNRPDLLKPQTHRRSLDLLQPDGNPHAIHHKDIKEMLQVNVIPCHSKTATASTATTTKVATTTTTTTTTFQMTKAQPKTGYHLKSTNTPRHKEANMKSFRPLKPAYQ